MLTAEKEKAYLSILSEELVPATGCTEPIALAYAAARLRDILGVWPERIRAEVSGNIIKNVKSVVVPNTGGLHGIEAAAAAGVVAGQAGLMLEVISQVTEEQRAALRERDKVRYARKVAAKKAAKEAQRAAILKGTAYEIRPQEAGAAHAAI